ncbi:membrane-spanning 4-domains subfamily A member 8-like isoform X1 [Pipistrellus kuhlii]|uniref:membrane-spanning 4-domains subfamily A member 8-like isoform X1 n=1 Tax=Pipistrellus kuhlii TaxID=59472 RepID=UPI001E272324|nr:membrane-spanning 4-domains subfamily A member 8-like isoform X1 [Pipistrellus kuhlii]
MDLMTSAGPTANSVFVMAPHNGHPVIPESMSQVPLYPLTQPQVHQISGNPPGLEPPVSMQPAQRSFKEAKVLGAIQILIGLIHIGLGSIIGMIVSWYYYYTVVSFYGGYPFWGGILFIISGSLSVASEELPRSSCLLKDSMGLSITSAVCSVVGILLLITDMVINSLFIHNSSNGMVSGIAISAMLFIFSLLEFCIACTSAHFGCKLVRDSYNNDAVVFQTVYVTNLLANPEPMNSPPSYSSDIQDYK